MTDPWDAWAVEFLETVGLPAPGRRGLSPEIVEKRRCVRERFRAIRHERPEVDEGVLGK